MRQSPGPHKNGVAYSPSPHQCFKIEGQIFRDFNKDPTVTPGNYFCLPTFETIRKGKNEKNSKGKKEERNEKKVERKK